MIVHFNFQKNNNDIIFAIVNQFLFPITPCLSILVHRLLRNRRLNIGGHVHFRPNIPVFQLFCENHVGGKGILCQLNVLPTQIDINRSMRQGDDSLNKAMIML